MKSKITNKCHINDCDKPLSAKHLCKNHYEMNRIRGRTYKIVARGYSTQERLTKYSKYNPQNGCIEWLGGLSVDGYGQIKISKKRIMRRAHRLSWELHHNKSAKGFFILHSCDNRKCINPKHLMLGNHKLNMQDMKLKNRQAKGSIHGNSKLDEQKVIEIHKLLNKGMKQIEIAKIYNVHQSIISSIKLNKTWGHVEKVSWL